MKNVFILVVLASLPRMASALTVKEKEVVNKVREVSLQTISQDKVVLADAKGLSLYTFDLDTPGKSNCKGECIQVWPPLTLAAGAVVVAPFGKIKGNDGKPQLTL